MKLKILFLIAIIALLVQGVYAEETTTDQGDSVDQTTTVNADIEDTTNPDATTKGIEPDEEAIEIIDINLDNLDMSIETQQTLTGQISEPNIDITVDIAGQTFLGVSDEDGYFSIDITLSGADGQATLNAVMITGTDSEGNVFTLMEGEITFMKCGYGIDWSSRLMDLTPAIIIPDHLIDGISQFGFQMEFDYRGNGQNAYMNFEPSLERQNSISGERAERVDEELFSGASVQCSEDWETCYFIVNLAPWSGTKEELKEKLMISLPLVLRLDYMFEKNGEEQHGMQEECIDINILLDIDMMDHLMPTKALNASIKFFNGTGEVLGTVKSAVDTTKGVVLAACGGLVVTEFFHNVGTSARCIGAINNARAALAQGRDTCNAPDNCQDCLDALKSRQSMLKTRNYVCDRLFCPSVPTIEKHTETYVDPITKATSSCINENDPLCKKEYKFAWDSAGLLVDEWQIAQGAERDDVWGEIDEWIQKSQAFCPSISNDFPEQVVPIGDKWYFIDENKQVRRVIPRRLAESNIGSDTITVYGEEYIPVGSFLGPGDYIPEDILLLIAPEDEMEENYVFDPTSNVYDSLRGGCLPALSGYVGHWVEISGAVEQCLRMVALEGEGTPGLCKAILSRYVCDTIWDAVRCLGGGLTEGTDTTRETGTFLDPLRGVSQAMGSVTDSVSGRYGDTAMFDVMFNQRKLVHAACLGFFTGDSGGMDLNAMTSAEIGMPVLGSEALVAPATRRFILSNPFASGYATFLYHIGYAINAGADVNYDLSLKCSQEIGCPEFGNNGACDCVTGQETMSLASGTIPAGDFFTDEILQEVQAPRRFDRVVLEWSWINNQGIQQTERIEKSIKEVGASAPGYCKFALGEYTCKQYVSSEGSALFVQEPRLVVLEDLSQPTVMREGLKLEYSGSVGVRMPEGETVPKFLSVAIINQNGRVVHADSVRLNSEGEFALRDFPGLWPRINQLMFSDEQGNYDCDAYNLGQPAMWDVIIGLKQAEKDEFNKWVETDSLVVREGVPQVFEDSVAVACSQENMATPKCDDGWIYSGCWCRENGEIVEYTTEPNLYCCNGRTSVEECDLAVPQFVNVELKAYRSDGGTYAIQLADFASGDTILIPKNQDAIVEFPVIQVQDSSAVDVTFNVEGYPSETVTGTSFIWYPNMPYDEYDFIIQFVAEDETGLQSFYPEEPVEVHLRRVEFS